MIFPPGLAERLPSEEIPVLCQSNTGDPELFNGWPAVSVGVGSVVEFTAPDPDDARALAAALMDDLVGL